MSDREYIRSIDGVCCPETGQPLERIDDELCASLNEAVEAGELVDDNGDPVERRLQDGLVRSDGQFVYPIRDDIPNLVIADRIPVGDDVDCT